jgi:hypothetical protein
MSARGFLEINSTAATTKIGKRFETNAGVAYAGAFDKMVD